MSDQISVFAIVEGTTEKVFVNLVLAPYLAERNIQICAMEVSKKGQKGGDVKFIRVKDEISKYLKQMKSVYVTTFFDLYGLKEWPELENIKAEQNHENMIAKLYDATDKAFKEIFDEYAVEKRIIPYFAIYEFEALLFSEPSKLATGIGCSTESIEKILQTCGEPEKINNSPQTAPSKRLDILSQRGKFKKITDGIAIAKQIGIERMREKCPQFDKWLNRLESLNV
jgi:hypothetical protein